MASAETLVWKHPNRDELALVVTALFASNDAGLRRFQRPGRASY